MSMPAELVRKFANIAAFSVEKMEASAPVDGSLRPLAPVLEFSVGDLTLETADAVVNPAGAGLVDLAIRRVAGPALLEVFHAGSRALPGARLLPGHAFATPGFGLRARYVIHCGPPLYADNPVRARHDLAACHAEALRLARELGLSSISFPAIATGVYRYPVPEAAEVAVSTVIEQLREHEAPARVRFVLYGPATMDVYARAAKAVLG
jgi:O-acetyl-ADP-ribose deacetylase (regulator of RNase III)